MSAMLQSSLVSSFLFSRVAYEKLILVLGMVATATRTLLENLDRIPNEDNRTKVSILAFDTSLYFFSVQVSVLSRLHVIP
jgi:hypothetical protein